MSQLKLFLVATKAVIKLTILLGCVVLFAEYASAWDRWHKYSKTGIRIDYSRVTDIDTGAFVTIMRKWSEDANLVIVTGDRFICNDVRVTLEVNGQDVPVEGTVLANRFAIEVNADQDWLEILSDKQKLLIHTLDSCDTETTSKFNINAPIFVRSAPE